MLPNFAYSRPRKLTDAVSHLADAKNGRVHAGGTDLIGCLRDGIFKADTLVSISGLQDLHGIQETGDGGLRIGALSTITEVADNARVKERYAGLAQGASEVASPQLRNQGTIGGNLCQKPRCWYYRGEFHCLRKGGGICFAAEGDNTFHCLFGSDDVCYITHPSDTAPNLAALNATIHITGPEGKRTEAADRFHMPPSVDVQAETVLRPGEIVTAVTLPPPPKGLRSSYRKVRARRSWDFALAGVALALQFDGDTVRNGRVFLSGAAPIPWRSKPVEEAIIGKKLDDATIKKAAKASVEGAMPLGKNGYKIGLFQGAVTEELGKIAAG